MSGHRVADVMSIDLPILLAIDNNIIILWWRWCAATWFAQVLGSLRILGYIGREYVDQMSRVAKGSLVRQVGKEFITMITNSGGIVHMVTLRCEYGIVRVIDTFQL